MLTRPSTSTTATAPMATGTAICDMKFMIGLSYHFKRMAQSRRRNALQPVATI
jgi:hypothetical protein